MELGGLRDGQLHFDFLLWKDFVRRVHKAGAGWRDFQLQIPEDQNGVYYLILYMGVSKNRGTPKSSILIGFSFINHPFWGPPIFGHIHIYFIIS